MKITVDDFPVWRHVLIFLDDKLMKWVKSADEEKGEIVKYVVDGEGRPSVHFYTETPLLEVARGRVDIVLKPNAPENIKILYETMRGR
jgi:hypothetical protein